MRFLADECCDADLVRALRDKGHREPGRVLAQHEVKGRKGLGGERAICGFRNGSG